jgi:hypothetical protein
MWQILISVHMHHVMKNYWVVKAKHHTALKPALHGHEQIASPSLLFVHSNTSCIYLMEWWVGLGPVLT